MSSLKPFVLLSFNIHNGFFRFDDGKTDEKKDFTLMETIRHLQTIQPDVVCFQEVTPRSISLDKLSKLMSQHLNLNFSAYANADDLYGNGFFGQSIHSKIPFENQVEIGLIRDPIEKERRVALAVEIIYCQIHVWIINTHLDVFDRNGPTRLKQMRKIMNFVDKKEQESDKFKHFIVCGDMNCTRPEDYSNQIWKQYFKSSWNPEPLHEIMNSGFREVFDVLKRKAGTSRPFIKGKWDQFNAHERIDYIFLKSNLIEVENALIEREIQTSDHYPVIVNLKFPTKSSSSVKISSSKKKKTTSSKKKRTSSKKKKQYYN
jgi:endonuclease/exonuclease/phosphatase family metal-dependent hydrolase